MSKNSRQRKGGKGAGIVLAGLLFLSALRLPVPALAEENGVTLQVHYVREDDDYAEWSVWLWPEGGEGTDVPFVDADGVMTAVYAVPEGVDAVGFIVRTADWQKDVNADQFIDLDGVVSGIVDVTITSGVEGYIRNDEAAAVGEAETSLQDTDARTLKIHYSRPDEDYTGWSVWLWPEGGEGTDVPFVDEDGVMTADYTVPDDVEWVGFIVRTADWGKDINADQFIDVSGMDGGIADVYITSEVEGYDFQIREEAVTLKLHYSRPDGDYAGWSVWLWPEGGEGTDVPFVDENGVMTADYTVPEGVTRVGFIVRTADWGKDINADQFIDLSGLSAGTAEVFVNSGVEGYDLKLPENAVKSVKVKNAVYDGETTLTVTMTDAISEEPEEVFTLCGENETGLAFSLAEEPQENVVVLHLEEALDPAGNYRIVYDGKETRVRMPIWYSTKAFEDAYTYRGNDLGASWSKEKTVFRVWAPTASALMLNLYAAGDSAVEDRMESIPMQPAENGTWTAEKSGDLQGVYYTYTVTVGEENRETVDPYARAAGVNGKRAEVLDLSRTNPEGWDEDANPNANLPVNDVILYELHLRDLSMDESSGMAYAGKYLSLTETGTTTKEGTPTGLDHMKTLGITHLHLLPVYDFGSVDEAQSSLSYNWGYDPVNYNVPEGSYATDPYHGEVRIKEFKQMVKALHDNGVSVVMDVVYNHVYAARDFSVNVLVPGYFSRVDADGTFSNGSGCGNDTASERSMVRKYIVDSVNYWADEYHIDGFRFDLVGLLDVDTINEIVETVHQKHPDVIFYGEGWSMATNVTKEDVELATQVNAKLTPGFAYFNDHLRDALKGTVFDNEAKGFVSGAANRDRDVVANFFAHAPWCTSPTQTINYDSCHDNMTVYDRLQTSCPDADADTLAAMNRLSAAVVLTSQGIPFIMSGEEILRSKENADGTCNENSYNAGDDVNAIRWSDLDTEQGACTSAYYAGLIAFRKAHPVLRLSDAEQVKAHVTSMIDPLMGVVAFAIDGNVDNEPAKELYIIFNRSADPAEVTLPEGEWTVYVKEATAGTEGLETVSGKVQVSPISAMILAR